jgi:AraC-like DNA-binding protein
VEPHPKQPDAPAVQDFCAQNLQAIEAAASRTAGRPEYSVEHCFLACACMVGAPNLEKAIGRVARFYGAIATAAGCSDRCALQLRVIGTEAEVRFYSGAPAPDASASFMSALLGSAFHVRLFGWLIGEPIKVLSAETSYHKLITQSVLIELLDWPVAFSVDLGASCDFRIVFPSHFLQRPIVRAGDDVDSLDMMELLFASPQKVSAATAVRRIFRVALSRGKQLPSMERLARLCNSSSATLRRHLSREQSSLRAIREDCLRERAKELLDNRDLKIGEVAVLLGFSDAPCFRRAFRRWTRVSPLSYRRNASGRDVS